MRYSSHRSLLAGLALAFAAIGGVCPSVMAAETAGQTATLPELSSDRGMTSDAVAEALRKIDAEVRALPPQASITPAQEILRAIHAVEASMAKHLPDPSLLLADMALIAPAQVPTSPVAPPQVPPTRPVPQAPTAGDIVPAPMAPMSGAILGAPTPAPAPGTPVEGNVRVRPLP